MLAGEVQVKLPDGEMVAYRAQPAKGSGFPAILVVSEIFGVHEHIADVCRRLAKLYDDAPHAFHADYRPSYRKAAAEDGWQRMLDWFKQHGLAP